MIPTNKDIPEEARMLKAEETIYLDINNLSRMLPQPEHQIKILDLVIQMHILKQLTRIADTLEVERKNT
jgi:hypothetical protein